jgi:acylphosphatase
VQGVGFRQQTAARARSLGLAGWVANLADGSVEAVFEGPGDCVDSMVDWCRRGPSGAHVARVDERPEPLAGEAGFRVELGLRPSG